MKKIKGEVITIALIVILGLGALFAAPKVKDMWIDHKEAKLAKVEQKAEVIDGKITQLDATQLEIAAKTAQGTKEALSKATPTPAVKLADNLNNRTIDALDKGRNKELTNDQIAEMKEVVRLALSDVIKENKEATTKLTALQVELDKSTKNESKLNEQLTAAAAEISTLKTDIKTLKEENSWQNQILYYAKIIVEAYLIIAYLLPLLSNAFPVLRPISDLLKGLLALGIGATKSAFTATVKGVEAVRKDLKAQPNLTDAPNQEAAKYALTKIEEVKKKVDAQLKDHIYDANADQVDKVRRDNNLI